MTCGFLYACAGYFDYDRGHTPEFPGIEDFAGEVVHPQFWPEDLAYDDQRVVVIGSGATAVTLVPAMAERAAHVTMLQRSPTWIGAIPGRDKLADTLRAKLPAALAHRVIRTKNILFTLGFYTYCQRFPDRARRLLLGLTTRQLRGDRELVEEHFTPTYDPWDQRFCAVPDADLFRTIRHGDADVVTDHVDAFVPEGIRLKSGRVLEADLVVTATGLTLKPFGGIAPSVDGETVDLHEQFVWQGAMLTGLPNFAVCIGYTNASWTLRADLTHRLVCRVLNHLARHDLAAAVPMPRGELEERPLLDLSSGYIQRAIDQFPRQGDRGPWRVRQNYLLDSVTTLHRGLAGSMEFTPRSAVRRRAGRHHRRLSLSRPRRPTRQHHPCGTRLRATQISSLGHCRAQSGVTKKASLASAPSGARSSIRSSTSNPWSRSSRIQSPWARWNSTESSSGHSNRCIPKLGRSRRSPAGTSSSSGAQSIST